MLRSLQIIQYECQQPTDGQEPNVPNTANPANAPADDPAATEQEFDKLIISYPNNFNNKIMSSYCCTVNGTVYKNGLFLTISLNDVSELYEIVELLLIDNDFYVVGQLWQCGIFDDHLLAHRILKCTMLYRITRLSEFDGPPVVVHTINNNLYYRRKANFLYED